MQRLSSKSKRIELCCYSCGRSSQKGCNHTDIVWCIGIPWCSLCARVEHTEEGHAIVHQPSPGRMFEGPLRDPMEAWTDCYEMKPKRRLTVAEAKAEIQRAWTLWKGEKDADGAILSFYGWLRRYRPLFLTFRSRVDPWKRVQAWLIDYERK